MGIPVGPALLDFSEKALLIELRTIGTQFSINLINRAGPNQHLTVRITETQYEINSPTCFGASQQASGILQVTHLSNT